jgi:protein-tyrosine phosphatase
MGNICRSPTAQAVLSQNAAAANLGKRIRIDSAGTHAYHIGHAPDPRSQAAAAARGYRLDALRARQIEPRDFAEFDYILAMDRDNLADLERVTPQMPRTRPQLLMEFASRPTLLEVPDPYYGGADGFEHVLDLVEEACFGLLQAIKKELG